MKYRRGKRPDLALARAVPAGGRGGFPLELHDLAQARRVVEKDRLPVIRSNHRWPDVHERLVAAEASGSCAALAADAGPDRAAGRARAA
ncbi:hypothetical protein [Methylobacterium nigriterrae]|uniref:hypothetical protein n=1 Tax=Methylobacterium nigriterrae TaxID=3127512 RepID=UPI0030139918